MIKIVAKKPHEILAHEIKKIKIGKITPKNNLQRLRLFLFLTHTKNNPKKNNINVFAIIKDSLPT